MKARSLCLSDPNHDADFVSLGAAQVNAAAGDTLYAMGSTTSYGRFY